MKDVQCALCDRTTPTRSSAEVYGDGDPFEEPRPVIDGPGTGWIAWADRFFCPDHADAPRRHEAAIVAWTVRAAAAAAEWERANPRPAVPGKPWGTS